MDDGKIIDLFFERSEQAISQLSEKYGHICVRIAQNILKNREDAEECANDAYLGVWNTVPPRRPDPLISYLCRLVKNNALTKYHSNTAQKRNTYYDTPITELEDCIPSPRTTEDSCDARELSRAINAFLRSLDIDSRVMFVRRYWYRDSVKDIAKRFNITPGNAAVRLSRIRGDMKEHLEKRGISV
ncbi:MAG: sigma-70 family RNA polymerase sigma factor [Eubacterium sp.]|nr:sigma-70 family RNA polymerase sigma factor [Eubacterium sp.]